jgi:hypothetical protein
MKKYLPHHTVIKTVRPAFRRLTPVEEYGITERAHYARVASRKIVRPVKKITSRVTSSGMDLGITPVWMRRTRSKDSRLGVRD